MRRSWGFVFNLVSPGTPPLAYHVSAFSWGSRGHIRQNHVKMVPVSALSRATIWQPSVMEMRLIWDTLLSNHLGSHCKAFLRFDKVCHQIKFWHHFLSERQSKTWVRAPVLDMTVTINQTTSFWIVCATLKRCLTHKWDRLWEKRDDSGLMLFTYPKWDTLAEPN